jgi:hypothetical protein
MFFKIKNIEPLECFNLNGKQKISLLKKPEPL